MSERYLIWSNKQRGWWRANRHGYTLQVALAQQVTRAEALLIVAEANSHTPVNAPNSEAVAVLAPSSPAMWPGDLEEAAAIIYQRRTGPRRPATLDDLAVVFPGRTRPELEGIMVEIHAAGGDLTVGPGFPHDRDYTPPIVGEDAATAINRALKDGYVDPVEHDD